MVQTNVCTNVLMQASEHIKFKDLKVWYCKFEVWRLLKIKHTYSYPWVRFPTEISILWYPCQVVLFGHGCPINPSFISYRFRNRTIILGSSLFFMEKQLIWWPLQRLSRFTSSCKVHNIVFCYSQWFPVRKLESYVDAYLSTSTRVIYSTDINSSHKTALQ